MAKQKRDVRFTYQILNIKLISSTRSGEEAYTQLIKAIFENTIIKPTSRGKSVVLRTLFPTEFFGNKFYYGKISRFTKLENSDWLNLDTKEIEQPEIDPNLFPNLQETEYIFIPQAHRFILRKSPNFSILNAENFFKLAVPEVIDFHEDFSVSIEQSSDIFDQIYQAEKVERLFIEISYTNSDNIDDDAADWMDDYLKSSNTNKAAFEFTGDKNEGLNIETKLIKGALELAVQNGEVEATLIEDNRKTYIKTKDHPKDVKSKASNEDEVKNVMFVEAMQYYRKNDFRI